MRGFNKPLKQRHVQGVLKKYNLSILGLLEVKVNVNLVDRMMNTKFPGMSFMHNFHMCTNSRILVMWESKAVRLDVLGMSDQVIHVSVVCLHSQRVFLASFIYGRNSVVAWRPLWDFLINHGENISLPWILLGDFNCVRYPHEKMGGNPIVPKDMADLRNCINRLELSDVNHVGFYYTWFSLAVSSKLDRVMVNHHWSESNLDVFADFVAPVRKNWWFSGGGTTQFLLKKKLHGMKRVLKQLNERHFSHISSRAKRASEELTEAQSNALNSGVIDNSIVSLRRKAEFLLEAERLFLSQKAKCEYLKHSDRCSKFFHGMIKRNIKRNKIVALTLRDGSTSMDQNEIADEFVNFYRALLGWSLERDTLDTSLVAPGPKVEEARWEVLIRDVSVEEVKSALFNIEDDKVLGPDGFGAAFFKKAWSIVDGDVIAAVLEFFRSVFYKIIAKILTNRLVDVIEPLISQAQAAFVPGRSIVENIHMAQEMLKHYARKRGSPHCILKIDLQKAYDTVHWEFLLDTLRFLNFPPRFIDWIMECVSSTSYSISLGGKLFGFFKGARGLRQGDPLSPFLFVLCMEMLSKSLLHASTLAYFQFHPRCNHFNITHLVYADDLLIVSKGDVPSVKIILDCVSKFGKMVGLRANEMKSNLFMAAVKELDRSEIIRLSGYQIGSFPFRYLGIPLASGRLREGDYSGLVDGIAKKIASWPRHTLSYAGKLELLRYVVQGVECYWLSVLPISCGVIDKIDKICRTFMWTSKHPPIAWRKVCSPVEDGGLGLRDLRIWNKTLLAKTLWDIHKNKDTLWVKWINHYYWDNLEEWRARKDDNILIKKLVELRDELAVRFNGWTNAALQLDTWFQKRDGLTLLYKSFFDGAGRWPWKPIVWKPYILPKNRIIFWLVAHGKCLTKDRQPYIQDQSCGFCGVVNENAQHVFFECTVSRQLWARLWDWLGPTGVLLFRSGGARLELLQCFTISGVLLLITLNIFVLVFTAILNFEDSPPFHGLWFLGMPSVVVISSVNASFGPFLMKPPPSSEESINQELNYLHAPLFLNSLLMKEKEEDPTHPTERNSVPFFSAASFRISGEWSATIPFPCLSIFLRLEC
ncbi:uncharacterized protein [Henckelia pumila]|uniref:uncharacterized protein n=1 Tax=Henckelia pumila TaxID=405737 RepID=UPI003C6E9D50